MLRDDRFKRLEVLPITGSLGAEIKGVNLVDDDDEMLTEVKKVLHEYHVLAVREQHLDPQRLHQVARRFGPFSGNPVHTPLDGYEDIAQFIREPDDSGKVIGEEWHMDLAWLAKPPGITMLYGDVVPPIGGDTCFTSLEKAYQSLSPRLVEILSGLTAIHSGRGVYAINAAHKRLGVTANIEAIENAAVEHPVICENPSTGRRYVFVSGVLTHFKGMSEEESRPIIDFLIGRATRPEFNCRLRWEPHTLAMWNNPYVLHTAINDYSGYRRIMYRSTVEGEVPQAAQRKTPQTAEPHRLPATSDS